MLCWRCASLLSPRSMIRIKQLKTLQLKLCSLKRAKIWQRALHVIDSEDSLQSLSPSFQFSISLECDSIQPPCLPLGFSFTLLWAEQPSTQLTFYPSMFYSSDSSSRKCCAPEWLVLSCSWQQNGHSFHLLETFHLLAPFCFVLLVDTPFGAEMQISASFDVMNTNVFFINLPNDCCTGAHPAFS